MIDLRGLNTYRHPEWEALISQGAPFDSRDAGAFRINHPESGAELRCMVSAARGGGAPWDHVSVSADGRCPTWDEMDWLARIFFLPHEVALQFHVPNTDHVNHHPYCLHLWHYTGLKQIPRPPSFMVGPDSAKGRR